MTPPPSPVRAGLVLTALGHVAAAGNRLDAAYGRYQQAIVLREEIGPAHELMELQAGLTKLALRQKNFAQARAYLEPVLEQIPSRRSSGRPIPAYVYLTCKDFSFRSMPPLPDPAGRSRPSPCLPFRRVCP